MQNLPVKISLPASFFEEEKRCGHKVTRETKQLWAVLLDLMVQFDTVCRQHGIRYMLDSGTFLGAVRHQGFIPWDGDSDVIMLRSEYNRLCQVAPQAFQQPYFWQTNDTDPGTLRRHAQLRNSLTTGILTDEMKNGRPLHDFNQGIFLDVFILDEVPDDAGELQAFREELKRYLPLLWDYKIFYQKFGHSPWIDMAQRHTYEEFETVVAHYNGTGQKRVGNVSLLPDRKESSLFDKRLFDELAEYQFEGYTFPGPKDFDTYLTGLYGKWRTPVKSNVLHGGVLLDVTKPYTEYIKNGTATDNKEAAADYARQEVNVANNMLDHAYKKTDRLCRQVKLYRTLCIVLAAVAAIAVAVAVAL